MVLFLISFHPISRPPFRETTSAGQQGNLFIVLIAILPPLCILHHSPLTGGPIAPLLAERGTSDHRPLLWTPVRLESAHLPFLNHESPEICCVDLGAERLRNNHNRYSSSQSQSSLWLSTTLKANKDDLKQFSFHSTTNIIPQANQIPPYTSSPLAPDERVYDDGSGGGVAIASIAAELPAQQQERPQFIAVPNAVATRVPVISKGPIGTYEEFSTLYQQLMDRKIRKALTKLSVVGRTADTIKDHPVVELLHNRVRSGSKPGNRMDKYKIGLAIEGGGMRGAVSAGSAAAISLLGLSDAFDSVYGSSAGALIAAFFVSRQLNGTVIYSDVLPRAGKRFLDRSQLLPAMAPVSMGERKPVLNLDYLLNEVVTKLVPLDWDTFWKNNQVQPLNVIASGLNSMQSTALNSEAGHFDCFENLLVCLRASMVVPGVAGPLVRLNATAQEEPYADALIFEPIPFRSAIDDGCTHILTLRTRPDGSEVLGKKASGIYERFVAKRFLKDMNKCHDAAHYMTKMEHLKQYAEDVLILNEASNSRVGVHVPNGKGGGRHVHLLPIAPPDTCVEVNTLASSRAELVRGLKDGFSQAWDILGSKDVVGRFPGSVVASALFDCEDERQFEDAWRRLTVMFNEHLAVEKSVNFA